MSLLAVCTMALQKKKAVPISPLITIAKLLIPAFAALLAAAYGTVYAAAGDTLALVKSRGMLRCGVNEGIAEVSAQDASRRWTGLDADFCRAVAAAALGDAEKVVFVLLSAAARFPALRRTDHPLPVGGVGAICSGLCLLPRPLSATRISVRSRP